MLLLELQGGWNGLKDQGDLGLAPQSAVISDMLCGVRKTSALLASSIHPDLSQNPDLHSVLFECHQVLRFKEENLVLQKTTEGGSVGVPNPQKFIFLKFQKLEVQDQDASQVCF